MLKCDQLFWPRKPKLNASHHACSLSACEIRKLCNPELETLRPPTDQGSYEDAITRMFCFDRVLAGGCMNQVVIL